MVPVPLHARVFSSGLNWSEYAVNITSHSPEVLVTEDVTLTPGAHYVLSFDYDYLHNSTPHHPVTIGVLVSSGDEDSPIGSVVSGIKSGMVNKTGPGSDSRRFVAIGSGSIAVNTVQIDIAWDVVLIGGHKKFGSLLIDNISIKEVQKPQGF